jgi:nucleoside-diphosphate-sugar epimerase
MVHAKIFVTGAESFVGRALQTACADGDVAFSGVDLAPSSHPDVSVGDILDTNLADAIPTHTDTVVHLAALSRDADCKGRLAECLRLNVMGTLNVVHAARARGVRQVIFASSEWVYGNGPFPTARTEESPIDIGALTSEYALSKAMAEAALRQETAAHGGDTTVLRFGIIYGPRPSNWSAVEALAHAVGTQDEVSVGALATARRFIHVDDIARGILAALGRTGFEVFNVQGPTLTSLGDVIAGASAQFGRAPRIVESNSAAPSIRNIEATRFTEATGWRPTITLADGLASLGSIVTARAA